MRQLLIFFIVSSVFYLSLVVECKGKKGGKNFVPTDKNLKNCHEGEYLSLCNMTKRYPKKYISKMLNNTKFKGLKELFRGPVLVPSGATSWRSAFVEDKPYCDTEYVTLFPKGAYDINRRPRFVVNIQGAEQMVTIAKCKSDKCFGDGILVDYVSSCKQLFSTVRLLVLSENGTPEYGKFAVPSACICTYRRKS